MPGMYSFNINLVYQSHMSNIFKKLLRKRDIPYPWHHIHNVLYYSSMLAFFSHLTFIFFYSYLNIPFMIYFNVFSCLLFAVCLILCRKFLLNIAIILFISEVIIHAFCSVVFVGWNSAFHIYIICMVPLFFFHPTWSNSVKIVFTFFVGCGYMFLNYLFPDKGLVPVPPAILYWIRYFNFYSFFAYMAAYAAYYKAASEFIENTLRIQIEERRETMEALKESEELFRTIVTNSVPIISCINREGIFTLVEGKSLKVLGLKPESLVGKSAKELFCHYPEIMKGLELALNGQAFTDTIAIQGAHELVYFDLFFSPFRDAEGHITGIIAILNDISERKKVEKERKSWEDQLQRAEKMEAIGTLAGGVAHDLNNILAGIVGYPDLILMELPEDNPLRKPIEIIKDSGKKAAEIVQDLLTLARRGVSGRDILNLNHIIKNYLESPEFAHLRSSHDAPIVLKTQLDSHLLNLVGSRVHLFKTVMNLVINAVEAMPSGGQLTISTENRYIDRFLDKYEPIEGGDYVVLTITDTGVGISEEDQMRIFEPFYTKKIMGLSGSGLGMSVVWGTVKDHKGYIDIRTELTKGTSFVLYFPATKKEIVPEETDISLQDYNGKGESILVIDDVPEQREIAVKMLTAIGYSASAVESGEAAVGYLKENKVDLIILDMIMDPGMDGLDTYKKVLAIRKDQRVIIASGFSETARVREAQRLGAKKYVKKPYTLAVIARAVRDVLQSA